MVFVPLYREDRGLELSLAGQDRRIYRQDTGLAVGEELKLTGLTQHVSETVTTRASTSHVRVAAIIRCFPEIGMYPFSENAQSYTILSGQPLITGVYPKASQRMDLQALTRYEVMSRVFYPDCYGKTYLYAYAADGVDGAALDIALYGFAGGVGAGIDNSRMANNALYQEAFNNELMFLLLGASVALIVLTIYASTVESTLENERKRTGILQSMGVTRRQMTRTQAGLGVWNALLSVLIANILVAAVVVLTTAAQSAQVLTLAQTLGAMGETTLWRYPWRAHIALCAALLPLSALIYALPMRRIAKCSPVENIRS